MKDTKNLKRYYFLPIIVIIAFVPLVVRMKAVPLEGILIKSWTGAKVNYDFFSFYKSRLIIIFTMIQLSIFVYLIFKNKVKVTRDKIFYLISTYIVLIIIATLLAEHKDVALWGYPDRYEGAIVLISYGILLIISMNMFNEEKDIKLVIKSLIISAMIIGIIGIMQYLGKDIFQTNLVKKLMLPSEFWNLIDKVRISLESNKIYSTLFHYNYMGSYMAMLFPLTVTLLILSNNFKTRMVLILPTLIMFINWIASGSRAGVVGGIIALIILIILMRKKIIQKWKITLPSLAIFIIFMIGLNLFSQNAIINRLGQLKQDIIQLSQNSTEQLKNELIDVDTFERSVFFYENNKTLKMVLEDKNIQFYDENYNTVKTQNGENGEINILDDEFSSYKFQVQLANVNNKKTIMVNMKKDNFDLNFLYYNNEMKLLSDKNKLIDLDRIEHIGFEGKEKLGSARGYIWSRTLPLIKNKMLLGYGPDTFSIYFPQNDYIGKFKGYGTMSMIVDKPHNLYLQIALNTGILSLIIFLAIVIIYIISGFSVFIKNDFKDFYSILGVSIFVAIIGYLGAAFFNDSVVSVTPIFWILLGVGISINLKIKEKSDKTSNL